MAAPAAFAHANLASSDPAPGERLDSSPSTVLLRFTEQPELSLSNLQVLTSDGSRVDKGNVRYGSAPRSLQIGVSHLRDGTYTVAWSCISKVDGHATAGAFAFGVGVNPKAPLKKLPAGPKPNALEMIGRFFFLTGVALAFGGAVIGQFVYKAARETLRKPLIVACLVALAGVAILALGQHNAVHASWSALLKVPIGKALVLRTAFVLLALFGIGLRSYIRLLAFSLFAIVIEVYAGHAAGGSSPVLQIAVQALHFVAAAIWMGGLFALLYAIRGAASDEKGRAVRRYSKLAAWSLFVVAASGGYRAYQEIGSWNGLFHSSYGKLVIAKAALLLVLAGLGSQQRFWNLPHVRTNLAGLRRIGKQEITVAVVIFVATAMLTGFSPPPPVSAATGPLQADGTDLGHTVKAHLEVAPGRAGINTFTLKLETHLKPQTVTLRFTSGDIGPSELALRKHDDAWHATGVNMSIEGVWSVTATVQSATTSAEVPLQVATRCRVERTPGPKGLVLYNQTLPDGNSDTMYADPGKPNRYNEIHFTFFDPRGNELGIPSEPTITAWRPNHEQRELKVRRFSAGHFIASARLPHADWRFEADATPKGTNQPVRACFEQTI